MNGELLPSLVAAGGGGMLIGGIVVYENRSQAAMRRSRRAHTLAFPIVMGEAAAVAAIETLAGIDYRQEMVAEIVGSEDGIDHRLYVTDSAHGSVTNSLASSLPSLRITPAEMRSTGPVDVSIDVSIRLWVSERTFLRSGDITSGSRALLGTLTGLTAGERVSLRWAIRPGQTAPRLREEPQSPARSLHARLERRAAGDRAGHLGFSVHGLLLIRAESQARAKQLAEHVLTVVRARRGVGPGIVMRRGRRAPTWTLPRVGRTRGFLSARELLPLLGWPLGEEPVSGMAAGVSRQIAVPRNASRDGRRLFLGRDGSGVRPVALSPEAATHHLAVVGPSGVGKSVLLARGVLDQIAGGFGGVVLDPKADLVQTILERVPPEHAGRIVVLDPSSGANTPGLDLLGSGDPDLGADVIVGALSKIFAGAWGVRSDYYLRLAVRTLAGIPGATLTDTARLLTDGSFRRRVLGPETDSFVRDAWRVFEALPRTEQAVHVQAPVARVMGLLSRPAVRAVLASPGSDD